tara:strand:- start:9645 stop:10466 length:822 start_codon:yes stop_codon:yes gene_type:complete
MIVFIALIALQADASCEVGIANALAEQDYYRVLELTEEPTPCASDMLRLTARTEAAWAVGDLTRAGNAAVGGLDAYNVEGCAYHPNAAPLGFVAGLSLMRDDYRQGLYFFWAAYRVNDIARSLPRNVRGIVEHYADEFGTALVDDPLALNSPYLGEARSPLHRCGGMPDLQLRASQPDDFALLWVRYRIDSRGQIHGTQVDFAYPGPVPRSVVAGINDQSQWPGIDRMTRLLVLSPCMEPLTRDGEVEVCLPGYSPLDHVQARAAQSDLPATD